MMYSSDLGVPVILFGLVHILGTVSFLVGLFFLLFWSMKKLTLAQLYRWGWILLAAGILVSLLSMGAMHMGVNRRDARSNGRFGVPTMMNGTDPYSDEEDIQFDATPTVQGF